jgi:hypothetical protein
VRKSKVPPTKAQHAAAVKNIKKAQAANKKRIAYDKAHHLPTQTKKQHQASLKAAAAGRAAQARKRAGLKPLPKKARALAGGPAAATLAVAGLDIVSALGLAADRMDPRDVTGVGHSGPVAGALSCDAVTRMDRAADTSEYHVGLAGLKTVNTYWDCCAATAVAWSLFTERGIIATYEDVLALHLAAGGDDGAYIPDVLDIVASGGLAGARVGRFWPVTDLTIPGIVAGLRLPRGTHSTLILAGGRCVSWGSIQPVTGVLEEGWWIEWE